MFGGSRQKAMAMASGDLSLKMVPNTTTRRLRKSISMTRNLPDDVMEDILSRLPAKSIARFKCVSKSWKALFLNPVFIKTYLHRSLNTNNSRILIMYTPPKMHKKMYTIVSSDNTDVEHVMHTNPISDSFRRSTKLRVIGSCNGLICFRSPYSGNDVHIWNPSLRQYITLPPFFVPHKKRYYRVVFGFGYDATTDDYKVVKIVRAFKRESSSEFEIYRLSKGCWETFSPGLVVPSNICSITNIGVTMSGSVYWVTRDRIIVFNFADEVFDEMSLPNGRLPDLCVDYFIGELEGQLFLFAYSPIVKCFEVWVMKTHKSWETRHVLSLDDKHRSIVQLLGLTRTGEYLLMNLSGETFSYDPKTEQYKVLIHGSSSDCNVTPYVENLVSLC